LLAKGLASPKYQVMTKRRSESIFFYPLVLLFCSLGIECMPTAKPKEDDTVDSHEDHGVDTVEPTGREKLEYIRSASATNAHIKRINSTTPPLDFEYVKRHVGNINPPHLVKKRNRNKRYRKYFSNCLSCALQTWRWLHHNLPDIPRAKHEMAREPNAIIYSDSMHLIDPTSKQLLNKAELLNLIDNEEHVVYELESDSVYPVFRKCTTHNIKQDLLSLPLNHNNSLAGILIKSILWKTVMAYQDTSQIFIE